jgi:CO/xanthine dehydrogenase FAD-binding subunit
VLASARGTRRVPYVEFHTGYKKTKLAQDEVIRTIALQPRFAGYHAYSRKVGTRNAQAIAKLCLAGLAKTSSNKIEDVRLAIGSMAVTPVRLRKTEETLTGCEWSAALMSEARQALESEVAPIDDIRSSALYRLHVAGNLLQEFLEGLFV